MPCSGRGGECWCRVSCKVVVERRIADLRVVDEALVVEAVADGGRRRAWRMRLVVGAALINALSVM